SSAARRAPPRPVATARRSTAAPHRLTCTAVHVARMRSASDHPPTTMEGPMANETMKENWERESGPGWVRREARYDGMLAPWAALLDEAAAVAPGERVLDVGCGFGTTALDAAARTGPD